MTWEGNERRESFWIPPEIVEDIAERAAEKAVAKMQPIIYAHIKTKFFADVGEGFLSKLYYVVGVIIVGLLALLAGKGLLK